MKLLVIGNSHAACLIEAWRAVRAEGLGVEMDFFVRGGGALREFGFDGRRVFTPNPEFRAFLQRLGQKDEFLLSDYDAIVVIGHELSAFRLVRILNRHHVLGWPYRNRRDLPTITEACLTDALADSLDEINASAILRRIGPVTAGQKLIVVPQPYPSEIILDHPAKAVGFVRLCRARIGNRCQTLFEVAMQRHVARLGADLLLQPAGTVVHGLLTARAYTAGSARLADLDQRQPVDDILHANALYGGLILAQILETFG
ncbi:MAG: hypothetical protein IAE87_18460 [Rhodobacteraceae bacterium]|nr:hypothetical protein [Paracoccaceae bacterium]